MIDLNTILCLSQYYITKCSKLNFDKKYFVSLSSQIEQRNYLQNYCLFIGSGGTREAYAVSTKKVIKIVKYDTKTQNYGLAQNKNEVKILTNFNLQILPKLYNYASNFIWIETELVKPIQAQEFESLTGIKNKYWKTIKEWWGDMPGTTHKHVLENLIDKLKIALLRKEDSTIEETDVKNLQTYLTNPVLMEISELVKYGLNPLELRFDNMGKSSDGKFKLLDVGDVL